MAKSELQNQQINTLTEVTQGRQQVPPVSAQMTPKAWKECEEEFTKSLPRPRKDLIAKEPENQPEHSTARLRLLTSEAEYPLRGEGVQTMSFPREISGCYSGVGWIKCILTPQQLV